MRSDTATIVKALRILSREIYCEDGVATAVIAEAADVIARLRLTDAERDAVERAIKTLDDWQRIGGYHELHDDDAATLRGLLERTR